MTEIEEVPRVRRNLALGPNQKEVLAALRRHGHWSYTAGWMWTSPSATRKILDSLVRRYLVTVVVYEEGTPWEIRIYRPVEET